jgi:acyl carrier protein
MSTTTTITPAKSEIDLRVKKIIIEKLGIKECEIPNDALFTNDLGIDSLDLYEIFAEIEREFEIKIPDEDAENLRTVRSLINYIKNKN